MNISAEPQGRAGWSYRAAVIGLLLLALISTFGGVFGGPALGDHEALVADCARGMRVSGDWIVPRFLETPFIRKPPLGYWLVAAVSYVTPTDPTTGLPVTAGAARLPSALAALGTVLLLWKLGAAMFGRRAGLVAAVLASTSVCTLLYAANATVEMLLTFCCTWAFAHFWFATTARSSRHRIVHLTLFYIALGIAMLAKGPAPLPLVAVPLAFWWYTYRTQRLIARGSADALRLSIRTLPRTAGQQTRRAFTRLWVFPGIFLFLAMFVPWILAVAARTDHAWEIWNWQYLQRAQGDYEDTRQRSIAYYIPRILGLLLPWTLALVEGLIAPWIPRYARRRKALYFVGCWAVVGALMMSLMAFKKPYYVLPALPGFLLLITPVVERLIVRMKRPRTTTSIAGAVAVAAACTAAVMLLRTFDALEALTTRIVAVAAVAAAAGAFAILARARNKPAIAFGVIAVGTSLAFLAGWYGLGPAVDNIERTAALDTQLDLAGVPARGPVYWAGQRPDSRLSFYYGRASEHLTDPAEIVATMTDRTGKMRQLENMAVERATELINGDQPVYLILDYKSRAVLDSLPLAVQQQVHVVATVDLNHKPDNEDWLIVTNAAGSRTDRGHGSPHLAFASSAPR